MANSQKTKPGILTSIAKAAAKSTPAPTRQVAKAAPAKAAPAKAAPATPANSAAGNNAVAPAGKPSFDWATMPAPEVVVYHRAVSKSDVEATTPEPIKTWVKDGFDKTVTKGETVYTAVVFPTAEMAAEAFKLAKRYATFKNYTIRGGVDKAEPARVSIAVKVKETRQRRAAA